MFCMMKVRETGRDLVRCLGLAAAALLVLSTGFSQRAEALSLINPGAAPTAKNVSEGLTIEVRGGHGGGGGGGAVHGGGGGSFRGGPAFHASGIRSGGAVFRGGSFRAGPAFHGSGIRYGGLRTGGYRYGGYRHGGYRFAYRHHFHRHFYAPYYYDDYPYYHHRCRIIWTYYGPRRVCHWHHRWHHWHRHGFPFRVYG